MYLPFHNDTRSLDCRVNLCFTKNPRWLQAPGRKERTKTGSVGMGLNGGSGLGLPTFAGPIGNEQEAPRADLGKDGIEANRGCTLMVVKVVIACFHFTRSCSRAEASRCG